MSKPRQPRKISKALRTRMGLLASLLSLACLAGALVNPIAPRGIAFQGVSQRFLTPNGVERNIYFKVQNDACAGVSGKVFDLLGHQISGMTTTGNCGIPSTQALVWDGTGARHTGVYLYEVTVGDQTFTGTVVVIR